MAETSVILSEDHFVREAQTFPQFPGSYFPGVPVPLSSLGLSEEEAKAMIAELGLPLTFTSAAPKPPEPESAGEPDEEE